MVSKRFDWGDHACSRWCKVHFWWDFEQDQHVAYPQPVFWRQEGLPTWARCLVFIGPPAYYPKKPNPIELMGMRMACPHDPPQLTCNTCRRHHFHALPI
jgi:hypothetical protein